MSAHVSERTLSLWGSRVAPSGARRVAPQHRAGLAPSCWSRACWVALLALLWACGHDDGQEPGGGAGGALYESASPGYPLPAPASNGGWGDCCADASVAASEPSAFGSLRVPEALRASETGEAPRAEGDIVQAENDRLYVLSRTGKLSVLDRSDPDRPRLLASDDIFPSSPRALYVRAGIVFELFVEPGDFSYDPALGDYVARPARSIVRVLDAQQGATLTVLDEVAVPGELLDSRLRGNQLYLITESGFPVAEGAGVFSFDVADPARVTAVDTVSLKELGQGWRYIVSFSEQRLYLSVPLSSSSTEPGSPIFVVDISDPTGLLLQGQTLQLSGGIDSRWELDEHEGVLRAVSQRYMWPSGRPPQIETFQIESSFHFVPLAAVELIVPDSGLLRSARFEGPRAYVMTQQTIDPVITVDLSDAAHPRQAGAVYLPGAIAYIEPHGDRLLGFGLNSTDDRGPLAVWLVDVSDLATPLELAHVSFGGSWSTYGTDLDQLPQAFEVLPDAGLVLAPFVVNQHRTPAERCEPHSSGVQLIDWQGDTLALRGLAELPGGARRGSMQGTRLWAIGDRWLASFDVDDRAQPRRLASVPFVQLVDQTLLASEDRLVRIGHDPATGVTDIDVTTPDAAHIPGAASLPIPAPLAACPVDWQLSATFAEQSRAYLLYAPPATDVLSTEPLRLVTVDLTNPSSPALLADASLAVTREPVHRAPVALARAGSQVVAAGSTLAFVEREFDFEQAPTGLITRSRLAVVDGSEPGAPRVARLALPDSIGATDLLLSSQIVATSHYVASPVDAARVRFYLDRVDISNPSEPRALRQLNIPGSLLAFDAEAQRAIVLEYLHVEDGLQDALHCNERFVFPHFEPESSATVGECSGTTQALHLIGFDTGEAVILGGLALEDHRAIAALASTDDRLFARISSGGAYLDTDCGGLQCYYHWTSSVGDALPQLLVLGGIQSGHFESGWLALANGDRAGGPPLTASGQRAALWSGFRGDLVVVDASDTSHPALVRSLQTTQQTVEQIQLSVTHAIAALGADGIRSIPLSE
jgi:hypothetical protein